MRSGLSAKLAYTLRESTHGRKRLQGLRLEMPEGRSQEEICTVLTRLRPPENISRDL